MNLDFEDKFRHIIKKIGELGELYAEAKGQSWQSQELKYSVVASLVKSYGEIPLSRAELLAKGSDEYKQYLKETADAIRKELRLKAQLEKWKAKFESMRSLSSLEKAQINSEGH